MSAEAAGDVIESDHLGAVFKQSMRLCSELPRLKAGSDEQKEKREEAIRLFHKLEDSARQLDLYSENEHHTEHTTQSLRLLLIPAYLGRLYAQRGPAHDDPDRDAKRLKILEEAEAYYHRYLETLNGLGFEFAEGGFLKHFLELKPGMRREREAKVAHMKARLETSKTVSNLEREMLDSADREENDDLEREHAVALLHLSMLDVCDSIESLGIEVDMLRKMQEMRANGMRPDPQKDREAARAASKPEPPMVLTSEDVKRIAASGGTIDRSNYKLITRGHGPIGAPTMTLDQVADMEMAQAREAQARQQAADAAKAAIDEDSEEAVDAATYEARQMDEWKDHHRRGEGNRHNKG